MTKRVMAKQPTIRSWSENQAEFQCLSHDQLILMLLLDEKICTATRAISVSK